MEPRPRIVLHTYWRSSSAYRVRIALGVKGIAWEPVFVNLLEGEQKKESHVEKSPMGYVPVLSVNGTLFVESVAILELLDELFPTPKLYPGTPEDRAHIRAMVEVINAGTQPLQNLSTLAKVGEDKEKRTAWLTHFIGRGLSALEALIARHEAARGTKGPFAYGDTLTAADVLLVPQVYAARRFNVDLGACPRVVRAADAANALPYVAAAAPEAQPDARP